MSLIKQSYIAYVNLSYRVDKRAWMEAELERVGLKAERYNAIRTDDYKWDSPKWDVMYNRTKGACGCMISQMNVMKEALMRDKNAVIFEDDLIITSQIHERFEYIDNFINNVVEDWWVIWLGGTVHINPPWWWGAENHGLPNWQNLGRDCEYIGDERMFRSFGSFSTHAYICNKKHIPEIIQMLDEVIPVAWGIDHAFIMLAPKMVNFVHLPGCIIQKDIISDIGCGETKFSSFASLGKHWFCDKIEDFDFKTYNWGETLNF